MHFLQTDCRSLVVDLSSTKGPGLILLRMCNEMQRRLSKTSFSELCGHILLFLSHTFPAGERSGANIRGDYNLENVLSISLEPDSGIRSCLLRCLYFSYHPAQCVGSDGWRTFESVKVPVYIL